jgi:hypothetical protein
MAADLEAKQAPAAKHEAFVEAQLRKVRHRIRLYDLATALLGFVFLTLLAVLGIVLWDRLLGMASGTRLLVWGGYGVLALVYLALTVVRPLLRPINPYFAARQVEQTLPNAKNSVINWLDLRQRRLPPAIHQSLGYRAAKDLTAFDVDRALSARQSVILGVLTAIVGVALGVALSVFRPTTIELVDPTGPDGHNITVPMHQSVAFKVLVGGRVPSADNPDRALKLLFRYHEDEPYQERMLERGDSDREWQTRMPPSMVHSDFFYKVVGGHAETPEYQVRIEPPPLLSGHYDVTYRYPYLGSKPETFVGQSDGNLRAVQGTQVTLVAYTNSPVKQGYLEGAGGDRLAEVLPRHDPQAMTFHFTLDREPATGAPFLKTADNRRLLLDREGSFGKYRIRFESADAGRNVDPIAYSVEVTTDLPPNVVLEKPAVEKLPADGVLELKGRVSDDHGLTRVSLQRRIVGGADLPPAPYREGKLQLVDETYLRDLEYKDALDLRKPAEGPGAVKLEPDMEIEFWLQAADDYTYPKAHVAESQHYKVKIEPSPADKAKQEEERRRIEEEKKQHEKSLDKQLADQNQRREEQPKPEDKKEQERKDQEIKNQLDKLKKAQEEVAKEQKKPGDKGNAPPKPEDKGDGNKAGPPQPQAKPSPNGEAKPDQQPANKEQKGEAKQQGKPTPGAKQDDKAQEKGPGKQDPQSKQGEGKPDQKKDDKGQEKGPGQQNQQGKGDSKPDNKQAKADSKGPGQRENPGNERGSGDKNAKDSQKPSPDGKPQGKDDDGKGNKPGQTNPKGDKKGPGKPDAKPDGEKGEGKGTPQAGGKGDKKAPDKNGPDKGGEKSEGKGAGEGQKGAEAGKDGQQKPASEKPKNADGQQPKGVAKGPGGEKSNDKIKPEDATKADVMEIAKGLDSGDKGKQQDAARKLTDIAAKTNDPAIRDLCLD